MDIENRVPTDLQARDLEYKEGFAIGNLSIKAYCGKKASEAHSGDVLYSFRVFQNGTLITSIDLGCHDSLLTKSYIYWLEEEAADVHASHEYFDNPPNYDLIKTKVINILKNRSSEMKPSSGQRVKLLVKVLDEKGNRLRGVQLSLYNENEKRIELARSSDFTFDALHPDNYILTAEKEGYIRAEQKVALDETKKLHSLGIFLKKKE